MVLTTYFEEEIKKKNKPKFNYAELSFLTQLGLQLSLFLAWSGLVWPVLAWYDLFWHSLNIAKGQNLESS